MARDRRASLAGEEDLNGTYHRLRQSGIDEELFEVIAGFEALAGRKTCKPNIHEKEDRAMISNSESTANTRLAISLKNGRADGVRSTGP